MLKNTLMLKRIAVITLVLFSLFVMADFVLDSDAKRPPPKKKKTAPPAPKPLSPDTGDVPLPDMNIDLDSGGCKSKATGEVSGSFKGKTEMKVTPPKTSGSGSCGCDSAGCSTRSGSLEASITSKTTGDNGVDSASTTVTAKTKVDDKGNAEAEVEVKFTFKWKR